MAATTQQLMDEAMSVAEAFAAYRARLGGKYKPELANELAFYHGVLWGLRHYMEDPPTAPYAEFDRLLRRHFYDETDDR